MNGSSVDNLQVLCNKTLFTLSQKNYMIDNCNGNLVVQNASAAIVLYNQTMTANTVSILLLNATVFDFFKDNAETVSLVSTKFGLN